MINFTEITNSIKRSMISDLKIVRKSNIIVDNSSKLSDG